MINKLCFRQLFPDGHLDVVPTFFTASIWLSDITLQLDGRKLSNVIKSSGGSTPYFYSQLMPKGPKKVFWRPNPPPPYLKVYRLKFPGKRQATGEIRHSCGPQDL